MLNNIIFFYFCLCAEQIMLYCDIDFVLSEMSIIGMCFVNSVTVFLWNEMRIITNRIRAIVTCPIKECIIIVTGRYCSCSAIRFSGFSANCQ